MRIEFTNPRTGAKPKLDDFDQATECPDDSNIQEERALVTHVAAIAIGHLLYLANLQRALPDVLAFPEYKQLVEHIIEALLQAFSRSL